MLAPIARAVIVLATNCCRRTAPSVRGEAADAVDIEAPAVTTVSAWHVSSVSITSCIGSSSRTAPMLARPLYAVVINSDDVIHVAGRARMRVRALVPVLEPDSRFSGFLEVEPV
jgi:hypothetical protein